MEGRELDKGLLALVAMVVVALVVLGAGVYATVTDSSASGGSEELTTAFRPPEPYDLADLERSRPLACRATERSCIEEHLVAITRRHGPRAALELLALYQRSGRVELSVNDHDLAHAVGRQTADRFGGNFQAFDLCSNAFNYGCPHGFFEHVLSRTDTPKQAATLICESLGADRPLNSGFSCYHGVGHGVMMAEAYDLDRSLEACNTLGGGREGCWQGVFMENVNAGMRGEARTGVFRPSRPLAPCERMQREYRHQCFINHAGYLMNLARRDIGKATGYCMAVEGADRSACLQSIGLMVTNPVWQKDLSPDAGRKPESLVAWELCTRFPAGEVRECVIAAVDNLANFDDLDVGRSARFCARVTGALKRDCYVQIGSNLWGRTHDEETIRRSCAGVPATWQDACMQTAGLDGRA